MHRSRRLVRALVFGVVIAATIRVASTADDPLEEAQRLNRAHKPREALAALATAKGRETEPLFLALRGQTLIHLRRFSEAKADLEKVPKDADVASDSKLLLASIEFFYGRDERAAALLEEAASKLPLSRSLSTLIDGPFAAKWGDAASACRERSKDGHYLVYSDIGMTAGTSARPALASVATIGQVMDLAYKAYGKVFDLPRDDGLLHRVYVFAHREDFLVFTKALGYDTNSLPSTYLGGFDPLTRILAVDGTPDQDDANRLLIPDQPLRVLLHEGFHQFNDFDAPDMPNWFDEGLAEYFAPSQVVSKTELKVGGVDKGRYEHLRGLLDGTTKPELLPLRRFLTLDRSGFYEAEQCAANYAQAWGFVHFLLSSEKGKKLARAYVKALRDAKGEKGAFAETFGKEDLDAMERDWRKHVKGL